MGKYLDIEDVCAGHPKAIEELRELYAAARRYEIVRRLNPEAYAMAYRVNITTGKPFDEIVDDMAAFVGITK